MKTIHRTESIADVLRKKREGKSKKIEDETERTSPRSYVRLSDSSDDPEDQESDDWGMMLDEAERRSGYIAHFGGEDANERERYAHRDMIGPVRLDWWERETPQVSYKSALERVADELPPPKAIDTGDLRRRVDAARANLMR